MQIGHGTWDHDGLFWSISVRDVDHSPKEARIHDEAHEQVSTIHLDLHKSIHFVPHLVSD